MRTRTGVPLGQRAPSGRPVASLHTNAHPSPLTPRERDARNQPGSSNGQRPALCSRIRMHPICAHSFTMQLYLRSIVGCLTMQPSPSAVAALALPTCTCHTCLHACPLPLAAPLARAYHVGLYAVPRQIVGSWAGAPPQLQPCINSSPQFSGWSMVRARPKSICAHKITRRAREWVVGDRSVRCHA